MCCCSAAIKAVDARLVAANSSICAQVFHWLVQDRVEYVETTPTVSTWAHIRIVSFMAWLLVRSFSGTVH